MRLRRTILLALLTSLALVVNLLEGGVPMPLPGMRLGAANAFALTALVLMGARASLAVTLLRVLLAWLLSGNPFAFFCSLTGGLFSTAVMAVLYTKFRELFSLPWISVAGAWAFNAGQILVAALLIGDARVFYYLPPLLIAGTVAGWAVGLLARALGGRLAAIVDEGAFEK